MSLSADIISQFVKATKDDKKTTEETTLYGTTVEYNGKMYVRIDGSDRLTPVSTTADTKADERVTVMIKNHAATVTGNISSPAARTDDVKEIGNQITEFDIIIAGKVSATELEVERGRIDNLYAENVAIKQTLSAQEIIVSDLEADNVTINEKLTATEATIATLETTMLTAEIADLKYASIEELEAVSADFNTLESTYADFEVATINRLAAMDATILDLEANTLTAVEADLRYANIDFSNISKAAMEYFYANSGLIENVAIGDATISGTLVGVTILGDYIKGGTVVADKLVIKGEDGLYYKLNTDGVTAEEEQTDQNSLNGQVILAKSVTASKIMVDDLVAFDATIGGLNISDGSIYSGVKSSIDNTTSGMYMDSEGQMALGDANAFIKYYKDESGNYKLAISAESISFSTGDTTISTITDLQAELDRYKKHFEFTENGFVITDANTDNRLEMVLDGGVLYFKKNGEQFGKWDGIDFYTGNIIVQVNERAQFGNFAYVPRSDESLMFLKVGG